MQTRCIRLGFVALVFTAFACSAAGADPSAGGDPNAPCVPGDIAMCACTDGTTSVQACNGEGAYDPCSCGGISSTGGNTSANGGSPQATGSAGGSSGAIITGGMTGSGGITGAGGIVGSGGLVATGGVAGAGGVVATGGVAGAGGAIGTGGVAGAGGTVAECPAPPAGSPALAVEAWSVVNEMRRPAGAGCMNLVTALNTSAQAHCNYLALNGSNPSCVPDGHTEVQGCPGFTGTTVQAREIAAGYPSSLAYTEVKLSYGNNPAVAIPAWIETVFHRIPLLDPWTVDMGYGGAADCDVIDIGRGMSSAPANAIAQYPYDGQTNVPPAWSGLEAPAPPPPSGGFPSSYPISIYARDLVVTEHVLTKDGDPTPLDHVWLDAQSPLVSAGLRAYFRTTAMLYGAPFELSTRYRVRIVGTYTGGALNAEWTFTTGATRPWGT